MNIAFRFKYIHSNGLFTRLCKRVDELSSLDINYYQENDIYSVEASGSQEELEGLAELISSIVPQSLFLKESKIKEIESLSNKTDTETNSLTYQVPYCIECQNKIIETLDPFTECDVCGFSDVDLNPELFEKSFSELADELIEKKELELITYNSKRRFSLLETIEEKNCSILVCDPKNISKSFTITQGELDCLMMIEKPSVSLKPKLMFYHEHELQKPFYPVFFADDKITLALTSALSKKGIAAVYCSELPALQVASALGEHVIVNTGRDMLPWKYPFSNQQTICSTIDDFRACVNQSGLIVDEKTAFSNQQAIEFIPAHLASDAKNCVAYEPAHGVLRSVILEHELNEQSLCTIYLSKEYTPHICSYSSKIGYTPMVNFMDDFLTSTANMLEAIAAMNESGKKLVDNFKAKFPKLYDTLQNTTDFETDHSSTMAKLWAMAAHFIGLTTDADVKTACGHLEATALEFGGKSGPRIDYKVMKTELGYQLDPRLAIRSCMSFKLAGVDEYLLSFGFIDSLADFIASQAEFADGNISIDGVVLAGSLFANHQLLMRTYNAITPNYKVYRNNRLSIDGANIVSGAVTLGNE